MKNKNTQKTIRLLAEPATAREIEGDSERRAGVYTRVHEDSSTESTNNLSAEVGLCKKSILLATSNVGKLKEFQAILATHLYNLISLDSQNIQLPEETGLTFVENALIKARAACHASELPSLADDSGLVVPALNGAPGIYSARFAGENATDLDNREKLLNEIKHLPLEQRQAYFHCVIVFMAHENDPIPSIAQASWHGVIIDTPRGTNGFGYDPIFYLPSLRKTAAELLPEDKNQLSHRALALQELRNTFIKII